MATTLDDHELRLRISSDAAARIGLDLRPLVAEVAERLRRTPDPSRLVTADEIADELLERAWTTADLREAYARALAEVHDRYLEQAVCVTETLRLLEEQGRDAWIARAISTHFAFELAWEALDRLDEELAEVADGVCEACGAPLAAAEGRVPDGLETT